MDSLDDIEFQIVVLCLGDKAVIIDNNPEYIPYRTPIYESLAEATGGSYKVLPFDKSELESLKDDAEKLNLRLMQFF